MEKTSSLNLRVNPMLKHDAETILTKLGIPMSTAIDMYLNQIVLSGGIPFAVTLPKAPANVDASRMTAEELHSKIKKGYDQALSGDYVKAEDAFREFKEKHA